MLTNCFSQVFLIFYCTCYQALSSFYSQLFGEYDADNDVSPDTEDPEAAGKFTWL